MYKYIYMKEFLDELIRVRGFLLVDTTLSGGVCVEFLQRGLK